MLIVDANHKAELLLGYQGESERTCVQFNMEAIAQEYPGGVVTLLVKRPGDTNPYPVLLVQDGDIYSWYVGVADTSFDGDGECQLTYQVGTVIVKTHKWPTHILESMTGATVDPPDPWESFVEDVLAAADEVMEAVRTVPETINAALEEAKESGEFDGVGIASIRMNEDYTLTITLTDGSHYDTDPVRGPKGDRGDTGNGIATIAMNPDYTLTITYTNGQSFTTDPIRGEKGDPGEKGDTGNGIANIVLNADYTLTINYTDGTHITTDPIRGEKGDKGDKGDTGSTPDISIGTVETLAPGSQATASMTGTPEQPVLNLGIPEGQKGDQGVPGEVSLAQLMTRAPAIIGNANGGVAIIYDAADNMPFSSIIADIELVQAGSGTPAPDNKRAISGWTGLNLIRTGRNLYSIKLEDDIWKQGFNGGSTEKVTDGLQVNMSAQQYSGSYALTTSAIRALSKLTGKATYSVEVKCSAAKNIFLGFNNFGKRTVALTTDWQRLTFTADFTGTEDSFQIYNGDANACTVWLRNFQFEYGNAATDYKAYEGTTVPVSWVTEAGTVYRGNLNIITGVLIVTWVGVTFNGSENWKLASNIANWFYLDNAITGIAWESLKKDFAITEEYAQTFAPAASSMASGNFAVTSVSGAYRLVVKDADYATAAEWKTHLGSDPMLVVYKLSTPLTYQLTANVIQTLYGVNDIWTDTGSISVDYPADTKLYIDCLTKSDTDMIADADIPSGKYFSVNNRLFLSTAAIARGSTIVPYSNCVETSVAEALNNLIS